jgi:glycosyltransferase involved in cell wall biosynthesis
MRNLKNISSQTTLELIIKDALAWANNRLTKYGYERKIWTCPNERRFVAERILSLCKINTHKEPRSRSLALSKIRSCEFYIHDLNIADLGGLILRENSFRLGKSPADVELHLLILNDKSIGDEIISFCNNSIEGWTIEAEFLGSSCNEKFPIAFLACRSPDDANVAIDRSVYIAYDLMRIAAIKSLSKKLEQRSPRDTTDEVRQSSARPDFPSTLELATKHQVLGVHKIQSELGLRVGFYVSSFSNFGGLEQWIINMAFALIRVGINPMIIVINDTEVQKRFPKDLKNNLILLGGDSGKLKSIVKKEKLDVLILNHAYDSVDNIVSDVNILEVIHNIYFWQKGNVSLELLRSKFTKVICISDVVRRYTEKFLKVRPDTTALIEHGLDKSGFHRPFRDYLTESDKAKVFRVVCVANIYPQKNILLLVRAFVHAFRGEKDVYLDIVGGTPHESYINSINKYLQTSASRTQVIVHGSVDRIRLSKIYANSSVFCLPSLYEGFGLATLEAMYFGLPVILSNTGHSRDLTSRTGGLIVDVASPLDNISEEEALRTALEPSAAHIEKLAAALQTVRADLPHFRSRALDNAYNGSIRTIDDTADDYAELILHVLSV